MKMLNFSFSYRVILLTTIATALLTGCAYIDDHIGEECNSHAYIDQTLPEFISTRFYSHAPVRMAIIPFSVPANLTYKSSDLPGLENQLAWSIHSELLNTGEVPIVEVLNRQDWPNKKEEFFTGNFGAISLARAAGYDLVLVGLVDSIKSLDTLSAYTKIIDVEGGVTVWSGKTSVFTRRPSIHRAYSTFWLEDEKPGMLYFDPLVNEIAKCIVHDVVTDEAA